MAKEPGQRKPFIIDVAEGTASGKSLVTEKTQHLEATDTKEQVVVLSLESFYRDLTSSEKRSAEAGESDYDHPSEWQLDKMGTVAFVSCRCVQVQRSRGSYREAVQRSDGRSASLRFHEECKVSGADEKSM